jgi:hypothetical protein
MHKLSFDDGVLLVIRPSGVARICLWRGLGARSATGTAGGADGAGGRAGRWVREGVAPSRKGVSGVSPPRKF